jgi:hypothetical protein
MSNSLARNTSEIPASPAVPRGTERLSKRARSLKLQLSTRLRAVRTMHSLDQRDVHDRPRLVSSWESPHEPHSPTAMHLLEQVRDPLSRPYALEVIACVLEEAEREDADPRQLSLLDLIATADR